MVGSGSVSITQNTSTLTFSTSQTLAVGDIVQLAASASYLTIASGSGTSYTTASLYTAGTATGVAFTIYKPIAVIADGASTPIVQMRGGSNTVGIGHNGGNTSWNASLSVVGATSALFKAVNTTTSSTTQGAGLQAFQDDGAATDAGHRLGFLIYGGASDANHTLLNTASIEAYAGSTFSASNGETYLSFRTTPSGAPSRSEKMKLDGAGNLTVVSSVKPSYYLETVKANGTCSTSINIDPTLGGMHTLTLSGACAIGVTNLAAGQSFTLKLTQSSTTAPTFTSAYKWPGAVAPTWSTSATKYDVLSCYSDDGSTLLCNGMVDVR